MKTLITIILIMAWPFTTFAQTVTATAGAAYQNANGAIVYTIGEPVISTLQTGAIVLTQGFNQNKLKIAVTAVYDPVFSSVKVFPNPTADKIIIHLENVNLYGSIFHLHDFNGRQLKHGNISGNDVEIELATYVPGIYVLTLQRGEKSMITYQIIKQ